MTRYGFMDFLADQGLVYQRQSENDISIFFRALSGVIAMIANDNDVNLKSANKAA